jgi:hypothetical protein
LEGLCVELADDFFGVSAVRELDERKAARSSGLAIHRHNDVRWFRDRCEVGPEV